MFKFASNEVSSSEDQKPKNDSLSFEAYRPAAPVTRNKIESDISEIFFGFDDNGKSASSQLLELPILRKEKSPQNSAQDKSIVISRKPHVTLSREARVLSLSEFVDESEKLLPRLDLDKNGTVSPAELTKAITNPQFRGLDAQTLGFLHTVQLLSTPDSFYSNQRTLRTPGQTLLGSPEGVTKNTLNQIKELKLAFDTNVSALRGGLTAYDLDKDGTLTRRELERKNMDFDSLASLLGADVVKGKNKDTAQDGFSIPRVVSRLRKENELEQSKAVNNFSYHMLASSVERLSKTALPDKLYGTPDNPLKSIVPAAIKQGLNQNCVFLSTLGWLANSKPEAIAKMMELNPDGKSFTVKFPGDPQNKITVPVPTEAELRLSNDGGKYGYWVNVLESAFGKYQQLERKVDQDQVPLIAGFVHVDKSFDQALKDSVQLLTGKKLLLASFTQEASLADIADFIKEGVSCGAITPDDRKPTTRDGFAKQHAYTILSFDPKGPDSGTVRLRNPLGDDGDFTNSKHGSIAISLKDFKANFTHIFLLGPDIAKNSR